MGFSVLMSVYAKEKPAYLKEAVESVFTQSLLPDEVLIMEDGPLTEELDAVMDALKAAHPQIVTWKFAENVKLGKALAKGVELCSNDLIARMDTDDIVAEDRFRLQYDYMTTHKEISVCGGWLQEFNDEGTYSKVKKMPQTEAGIRQYARYRNPFNHMTVMFRRSAVLAVGNYKHFPLLEDYELWSRMLAADSGFYNIPQVLAYMRTNEDMYGRRGGFSYFLQYEKLRKEQKQLGLLKGFSYPTALVLTAGMTLQPTFLRKRAYHKWLRS